MVAQKLETHCSTGRTRRNAKVKVHHKRRQAQSAPVPFDFASAYYRPEREGNDSANSYWNILPHTGETFIGKLFNPIEIDVIIQMISINESKSL